MRTAQQERLTAETHEERDARLERRRAAQQERLATETAEEREARQQHDRVSHRQLQDAQSSLPLLEQHSVQTKMLKFHAQIASLSCPQCVTCSEGFPGLHLAPHSAECMHCSHDKHVTKLYSSANDLDPGPSPPQLQVCSLW